MRLLHIMIRVKNYEESMRFYGELLGLKEVKIMDLDDCRLHYLADEYGNVQIELTENFDIPLDGYKNGDAFGHFAFETDSFDEFTQRLYKMGYKYLYEPFLLGGTGLKIAFVKDPDGNEIEIIENKLSQY